VYPLEDHAPVVIPVSNRIFVAGADGALKPCRQVKLRGSLPIQLGSIADNFMGEPQAVHCGPWFCLSSMASPSDRRSEFSSKPSGRLRCQRVRCNDIDLNVIAFGAFEQPSFETGWSR
jgi:hypothetical protein